ncbi:unnamed protein product [Mytilus edulis]|uniref:Protein kinase domain-containing protein n=1 Tax=Mytilus edulis TaxID=6550 RepID=A0A8S3U922_MYTED|nr:unnamed protein product [Mytilus edulis]
MTKFTTLATMDFLFAECKLEERFPEIEFERTDGILKKTTRYPSAGDNINGLIIHEAIEIWGYDEENLLIGLVIGTTDNVMYTWFKDNVMTSSGSMNIIVVSEPGILTTEPVALSKKIYLIVAPIHRLFQLLLHSAVQSTRRGAFGTVYKGKWTGLEVAIKAIPITKRARNAMLRTVEKEININSKLRHPNIIQFLAVARTDNTIYLVHEFIMGCNMEDAIFSAATKLDMDIKAKDKLYIMKQVVQAKRLLNNKVCDMGISRLKYVGAATTIAVGSTCGSPAYMAPECLLRQENTSPSTDIWSLGVTFIEFFTEKDAWSVDDELDPVAAIKDKMRQEVSPVAQGSYIPENVMVVLNKCVSF